VRRTDAALSIGDDFSIGGDANLRKHGPKFSRRLELFRLAINVVEPFKVYSAWDATASFCATRIGSGPLLIRADI
jgi:hypothetical protein